MCEERFIYPPHPNLPPLEGVKEFTVTGSDGVGAFVTHTKHFHAVLENLVIIPNHVQSGSEGAYEES
ncbi:MAG TPA: hypothetical protein VNN20_08335 [Thermodesulfobacteriota bacterium]|nr:hypothetical protein [Thermodesulfobacteriota bacterium]